MIRTLHIDIEGGWGGSSRSLFELVSRLDRATIKPTVLYRSEGSIAARYRAIGIEAFHVPEIYSVAPRPKNSAKILLASLPRALRAPAALKVIAAAAAERRADLLHLNYEGLHTLAPSLRRRLGLPMIVHSRTYIPDNVWGRAVVRRLGRSCDHVFFISPQEEARFRALEPSGRHLPGEVMWNIVSALPDAAPHSPPYAVYLGNIDREKGADRLIDIAAALADRAAPPLVIRAFGAARSDPPFAEALNDRVAREGLSARIRFEGHTDKPEAVLKGALALIRPSRACDPWGRDVIEATASGVPVLATGTFDGVVRPDETGFLHAQFNPAAFAEQLVQLAEDPALFKRLSKAGRRLALRHDGRLQAKRFHTVARALVDAKGA